MKPVTVKRFTLFLPFCLLLVAASPSPAARSWAAFGQSICDDQGEGIHILRYDNGEVKASVVCGENGDLDYVKQARYFDRQGRGLAQEETVPRDAARTFYREWIYEAPMGPPVEERLYDAAGKLVSRKPILKETPRRPPAQPWVSGTFNAYLQICKSQPADVLKPILSAPDGRQFFEAACECIAEKTVRIDEERNAGFMLSRGLDPALPLDRVRWAAARHLMGCLCPEAVPGSQLEEVCRSSATLESLSLIHI